MDRALRGLFWTAIAFAAGLAAGSLFPAPLFLLFLLAAAAFFAAALLWLWKKEIFLCLLPLIFVFGSYYAELRAVEPPPLLEEGAAYEITGMVSNFPRQGEKSTVLLLRSETVNGAQAIITVRVLAELGSPFVYGDMVAVRGQALAVTAAANPGQFDYGRYQQQRQGISGTVSALYGGEARSLGENRGSWLLRTAAAGRAAFDASLSHLPARQGDLIRGIFLGDKGGLTADDMNLLSQTGVMHAFSVSGLHVGYIILLISAIFQLAGIRRWWALALLLPVLFVYAAMTGFVPPVLRASIMATMLLLAKNLGREGDGFTALALASLLLLLYDPGNLFDIGFQLSFMAMLSILYFSPFFRRLLPWNFPFKEEIVVLLAAQIGLMPLLAFYFYTVSFSSFLVNTAACFLVGLVVVLSVFALPLSLFSPLIGALPLYAAGLFTEATWAIVAFGAHLPLSYRYVGEVGVWQVIAAYLFLFSLPHWPLFRRKALPAFGVMVAVLFLILFPWGPREGRLEVTFLDVGEGSAIHIRSPEGTNILLDAGGNDPESAAHYVILPYLKSSGVNAIDCFINSHAHADHLDGIFVLLDHVKVKEIAVAEAGLDESASLLNAASALNIPVTSLVRGDRIAVDGVTELTVLYPPANWRGDGNDASLALVLTYGETSFFFSGDLELAALTSLVAAGGDLDADVLLLPHHGSGHSYLPEFYQAVDPEAVVIGVGPNAYGHPGDAVVSYWQKNGVSLFRTDRDGAILFTSDGKTISESTFR